MIFIVGCNQIQSGEPQESAGDYSGTFCLNLMNLQLTLHQSEDHLIFSASSNILTDGVGSVSGDEIQLSARTAAGESFTAEIMFPPEKDSFQGWFTVNSQSGEKSIGGILLGFAGPCPVFDPTATPFPHFVTNDFTDLNKIERISKFRSGFGHSFTDGFETCRSMKHYFSPYKAYRDNRLVEIFAPADGIILSILDDGHGNSVGLNNKQVHIRPDAQPAFTIELYHVDLVSTQIKPGKLVQAGELLGYARLYFEDLDEHATSFDIAVWVNTPDGLKLISYFDVLSETVFDSYRSRGPFVRQDFVISQKDRDAAPLECSGEIFVSSGTLENWVNLP